MGAKKFQTQYPQHLSPATLYMFTPEELRPDLVNVFISYHHNDDMIAKELKKRLTKINTGRVRCFLDSEAIEAGTNWEATLLANLKKADWLVCVFTGEESDYCGYEVGVFCEAKGFSMSHNEESRIVCLHDVDRYPEIFHAHQNYLISFPPERPQKDYNETKFFRKSNVYKFLAFFYAYKNLYQSENAIESDAQSDSIIEDAKAITTAFREGRFSDVKAQNFIHPRIEIRIRDGGGDDGANFKGIPEDSEVSADDTTFALFNLDLLKPTDASPALASWKLLREAQLTSHMSTSWMDKIERDAIEAAKGFVAAYSGSDINFQRGDKIFRPILARHRLYYDGVRTFSVLFIETLPRQFLGKRTTSLLLAGLVLGSRFRFAYFEDRNTPYQTLFNDDVDNVEFAINCRQLRYDIERLEQESAEFGLLDREEFIKAFGDENKAVAEAFTENWDRLKGALFEALPTREVQISQRPKVKAAVEKFFTAMERENAMFLQKAIAVYQKEMSNQLAPILSRGKNVEHSTRT
jgi:hypothetical protein